MKILKQSVGIDVAKNDFKVCVGTLDEQLSVVFSFQKTYANNCNGIRLFLKEVRHLFTAEVTVQFILCSIVIHLTSGFPTNGLMPNDG
jgi:hypothetical protein